ncbi:tetratricopeptide repeat-containing sulfotransferase family protein [Alteromonas halophila]|uniref:Sulfotransferase family protein n=1 Tax=Alteromonas halophila TaxID=516698 RepID=A0A918MZV5_9ALTE|nr:sulfotransferase [Alteromonas halophila]GGW91058.1 hypothetical protein GCM10007391_26720 [Alteromonas halophila]
MEHLIRPHLEAGHFTQAQQAIKAYLTSLQSPTPPQVAEAAFWSSQANDFETAATLYQQACQAQPDHATHHYNLATALRVCGDIAGAEAALNRHIAINPSDAEAQWLRISLRTQSPSLARENALKALTADAHPPKQRVHAWYALGKLYEDTHQDDACFDAYATGAALRRRYLKYQVSQDQAIMQAIQTTFTANWQSDTASGTKGHNQVFIVGMPRSGTTLVESLLGAHQGVAMGGELNTFSAAMMAEASRLKKPESVLSAIRQTAQADFAAMGDAYCRETAEQRGTQAVLTDKLPLNFLYLGLIRKALPHARIVHVRRHPMDTIWSVYKHLFTHAYPFSYSLDEITAYYKAYRTLMSHWQTLLGDNLYTLDYETLIHQPAEEMARLTAFCGIEYDADCLAFYQRDVSITTGSATQVRQPINSNSVGTWQRFAPQLAEVYDSLTADGYLP